MKRDDRRAIPSKRCVSMVAAVVSTRIERTSCQGMFEMNAQERQVQAIRGFLARIAIVMIGAKYHRCGADQLRAEEHATYPSAVVSQRSSFGSSTSFRSTPSGREFSTITSGRVDEGALMTSLSVLRGRSLFPVVDDELPSLAPPTAPPPALLTGPTMVSGTLALRLDLGLDADIVSASERGLRSTEQ